MTTERSKMFPPTISPKESWGILLKAEIKPTKKLGRETEKAKKIKATTNSFQPKILAIFERELINHLLEKARQKEERRKTRRYKANIYFGR